MQGDEGTHSSEERTLSSSGVLPVAGPPAAPEADERPVKGMVLGGKYRLGEVLGEGGMGVVVEAQHLRHGGRVAIKLLSAQPGAAGHPGQVRAARLMREARAVAALRSPHVVRLLDVEVLPSGRPFLVLELLEGQTLAELLRGHGPLPWRRAVALVRQACEGLAAAHDAGIVHRDVKPSNLFLARESPAPGEASLPGGDGEACVKLLDFGVARVPASEAPSAATLTGASGVLGSLPYSSPEQLRSPSTVDARADVWSMGVTCFELVTGRLPFDAETTAGLAAVIAMEPPRKLRTLCPGAPRELEQLLIDCLSKRPGGRPADARALLARLDQACARRPHRPRGGAALLCALGLGAAASVRLISSSASAAPPAATGDGRYFPPVQAEPPAVAGPAADVAPSSASAGPAPSAPGGAPAASPASRQARPPPTPGALAGASSREHALPTTAPETRRPARKPPVSPTAGTTPADDISRWMRK
jgi:eukaryotic-like serine/threonine-protein kinase